MVLILRLRADYEFSFWMYLRKLGLVKSCGPINFRRMMPRLSMM
jgi:hypothetical protein